MKCRYFLAALGMSVSLLFSVADAAVLTWDITLGDEGTITDGVGTWINGGTTWNNGSTNVPWSNSTPDDAVFGGISSSTGYTVTVDATGVTAGSITFNRAYTLSGGTITLSGTAPKFIFPVPSTNLNMQPVISASISSTAAYIDIDGYAYYTGSTLNYSFPNFSGVNSISGTIRLNGGLVNFTNPAALPSATTGGIIGAFGTTIRVDAAGTYNAPTMHIQGYGFDPNFTTGPSPSRAAFQAAGFTGKASWNGNIVLDGNASIAANSSATEGLEIRGVISEANPGTKLVKTSTGTVILANSNTYTGGTEIYRESLVLAAPTGPAVKGNINFTSDAYSTYLKFAANNQLEDTALVNFNGSYGYQFLYLQGTNQTVAGINNAATTDSSSAIENKLAETTGTLTVEVPNAASSSYRGIIRNGTGTNSVLTMVKDGLGTLTLDGPNCAQFTGGLTVNQGTLAFGLNTPASFTPGSSIDVKNGAALDLSARGSNPVTIASGKSLLGGGTVLGSIVIAGGASVAGGSSVGQLNITGDLDLSNAVTAATMNWELAALSDLSGDAGTAYDQILVGGNLALGGLSTLTLDFNLLPADQRPDSSNAFWSSAHSWKIIDTASNPGDTNFTDLVNGLQPRGFFTKTVDAGDILLNFTPIVSADLVWAGGASGNKWDVNTTANWYVGGSPPLVTFDDFDKVTFNNSSSNLAVDIDGNVEPLSITVDNNASHPYTFNGDSAFSTGTLTKNGEGSLTVANSGSNVVINGLALTQGTLIFQQNGNTEVKGNLTGSGSLQQNGSASAVLALGGDNSGFSGPISVIGGTLKAGSATALGDTAAGTTVNGGTLDVGGFALGDEQILVQGEGADGNGAIVSTGAVRQLNALKNVKFTGDTTLGGDAFAGGESGRWDIRGGTLSADSSFKLTKKGTNTINISGCTVTPNLGDIDIQNGILYFDGISTLGDPAATATIASGATLAFWNLSQPAEKVVVSDGGRIFSDAGNNTFTGPITFDGAADTTIEVASNLTLTQGLSGAVGSTAGLLKTSSGNLTLTKASTYAGGTTLNGGYLILDSDSGYAVPGDSIVYTGSAAVRLNRGEETGQPQIRDTASIAFSETYGGQYLEIRGHALTLEGIDMPNYQIASDDRCAVENYLAGTDGLLIIDSQNNHTYRGIIRDNGGTLALTKRGPGILTLIGAKSGDYTGGLTVEEGTLSLDDGMGYTGMLPAAGLVKVAGAATLDIGSTLQTITAFQMTGGTLNGTGMLTGNGSHFDVQAGTINVILGGAAGLTKSGPGTVTLTNSNYYSGPTSILGGTLVLTGYAAIGSSPSIHLADGGILDVSGLYSPFYLNSQALTGSGTVRGTPVVGYGCAINPGTPLAGGTLAIVPYGAANGNLDLSGVSASNFEFQLSDDAAGTNNDKITVADALIGPSGAMTVNFHAFDSTLDTSNAYTLVTFGPSANLSLLQFSLVNNTRYNHQLTLTGGTGGTPSSGELQIAFSTDGTHPGPKTLTWNDPSGMGSYWDTKTTTAWKDTSNNDEQFYEMDSVTFNNNSTGTQVELYDAVYPASITVNNDALHDYSFNSSSMTGKISGATGIAKSGVGTLYINTNNDFAGEVSITEGTVVVSVPNALGDTISGTVVSGAGTLNVNGVALPADETITISGPGYLDQGALINTVTSTNNLVGRLTLADDATIGGTGTLYIGGAGPGSVNGGGNTLTKVGTNSVVFKDVGDTNLGDINLYEGRIYFWGDSGMGSSTVTIDNLNATNAELVLREAEITHQKDLVIGSHGGKVTLSTQGNVVFNGAPGSNSGTLNGTLTVNISAEDTLTLGHDFSGPGGLIKAATNGTLVLTGDNSYEGGTTLTASSAESLTILDSGAGYAIPGDVTIQGSNVIRLNRDEQIAPDAVVSFSGTAGGMKLQLRGHTQTLEGLNFPAASSLTASAVENLYADTTGTLILDCTEQDHTYKGILRDNGGKLALTKRGPYAQTLLCSTAHEFTGKLTVEQGILDFYGDGSVASNLPGGDYAVSGGTLKIGTLSKTIGAFQITDGLVDADDAAPGTLTSGAVFDLQGGTVEAKLDGTQGLTKTGPAVAVLKAPNVYTGPTTINEGTLTLAGAGQINVASTIDNLDAFVVDGGTHVLGLITGSGTTTVNVSTEVTVAGIAQAALLNDGTTILDGGTNAVGVVDGSGTIQVNDSVSLTAASITQGSLVIGGSSRKAPAPVPEPGVWLLLLAGLLGVGLRRRLIRR